MTEHQGKHSDPPASWGDMLWICFFNLEAVFLQSFNFRKRGGPEGRRPSKGALIRHRHGGRGHVFPRKQKAPARNADLEHHGFFRSCFS